MMEGEYANIKASDINLEFGGSDAIPTVQHASVNAARTAKKRRLLVFIDPCCPPQTQPKLQLYPQKSRQY
jgi:hypothetical protein